MNSKIVLSYCKIHIYNKGQQHFLTFMPILSESAKGGRVEESVLALAQQLGVPAEQVISLTGADIEKILSYLENQSLKFTGSGIQLLVKFIGEQRSTIPSPSTGEGQGGGE